MIGERETNGAPFKRNTQPVELSPLTEEDGPIELKPEDLNPMSGSAEVGVPFGKKNPTKEIKNPGVIQPVPESKPAEEDYCPPPALAEEDIYRAAFGVPEEELKKMKPEKPDLDKVESTDNVPTATPKESAPKKTEPVYKQLSPEKEAEQRRLLEQDIEDERKREEEAVRIKKQMAGFEAEGKEIKKQAADHDKKPLVRFKKWFKSVNPFGNKENK